jgi:hypothetical protein
MTANLAGRKLAAVSASRSAMARMPSAQRCESDRHPALFLPRTSPLAGTVAAVVLYVRSCYNWQVDAGTSRDGSSYR